MNKNKAGFSEVLVILIIVVLVGAVGFFVYQNDQLKQEVSTIESNDVSETITEVTTSPTKTSTSTTDSMADWKTYSNTNWGFSLKFPNPWRGYNVQEHNYSNQSTSQYTADICFFFTQPDAIPACILQITVFSAEEWNRITIKPTSIGQINNFYFIANDHNPQCLQLNEFQCNRSKEISQILSTFEFIN